MSILNFFTIFSISLVLLACSAKPNMHQYGETSQTVKPAKQVSHVDSHQSSVQKKQKLAPSHPILERVQRLMEKVHNKASSAAVLDELNALQAQSVSPLYEEFAFWKLRLLLQYQDASAMKEALFLIKKYPDHRLIPDAYLWIVKWQRPLSTQDTLYFTGKAMQVSHQERVTQEAIALGEISAQRSQPEQAVRWYLYAANADVAQRSHWLAKLSLIMNESLLVRLHQDGLLKTEAGELLYVQMARNALLVGKMSDIQLMIGYLEIDHPNSQYHESFVQWLNGAQQKTKIGVMLPISGKYARYGQQSLRGIRLALESLDRYANIELHIADTAGGSQQCMAAYESLLQTDVIVGPLLSKCAKTVSENPKGAVSLMSLSNRVQTAVEMPQMFLHSLSLQMQAKFMAQYALAKGHQDMVLIQEASSSAHHEAAMFRQQFELGGGRVVAQVTLPADKIDYRGQLSKLSVTSGAYDGLYLAVSGKTMSLLGGQLAIVGVKGVDYYGSARWQDGHLLDDRGRYLGHAYFSDISFPLGNSPELTNLLFLHRQVWPNETPEKLLALAYDSTMIAVMVAARLGLRGTELMVALQDAGGFDGLTGHVRFNQQGIGEKSFEVFSIRNAAVVLLQSNHVNKDGLEASDFPVR